MYPSPRQKNAHIEANRREFARSIDSMQFASWFACQEVEVQRDQLVQYLETLGARFWNRGTKPCSATLSPGCIQCAAGSWSCLFINNSCNGRCFYCPTSQTEMGVPGTNTIDFPKPEAYADYVEALGFTGVSISGGEPLLTFDRTCAYLEAVARRSGDRVHRWVYTNGILADPDKLKRLADLGVGEIRFDIGATGFSLDQASQAVGVIPVVTVEIPSLPDHLDLMEAKLREMDDRGINFLNLHQLRATPWNIERLVERDYRFFHGPRVLVKDSELAALQLIARGLEQGLKLQINYCSFLYKNTFQGLAARRRGALLARREGDGISPGGYLRQLEFTLAPEVAQVVAQGQYCTNDGKKLVVEDPAQALDLARELEAASAGLPSRPADSPSGDPAGSPWKLELTWDQAQIKSQTPGAWEPRRQGEGEVLELDIAGLEWLCTLDRQARLDGGSQDKAFVSPEPWDHAPSSLNQEDLDSLLAHEWLPGGFMDCY